MSVEVNTSGIDTALKRMAGAEKKVRNKALKTAAEAFKEELKRNTPIDQTAEHLSEDIVISNVDEYGEIQVGYGKETAWRAHFVELGTIKQRPQAFIQRTEESMAADIMRIMENEIKRGLGL